MPTSIPRILKKISKKNLKKIKTKSSDTSASSYEVPPVPARPTLHLQVSSFPITSLPLFSPTTHVPGGASDSPIVVAPAEISQEPEEDVPKPGSRDLPPSRPDDDLSKDLLEAWNTTGAPPKVSKFDQALQKLGQ